MSITFKEFLKSAKPGASFVYHVGYLMRDRMVLKTSGSFVAYEQNELGAQAAEVWDAYMKGSVCLVQYKRPPDSFDQRGYEYVAIKRKVTYPYRKRSYERDDHRPELFGSFSGPRSTRPTVNRLGTPRPNSERAG